MSGFDYCVYKRDCIPASLGFDMGTTGALAPCIFSVRAVGREGVVCEDRIGLVAGEDKK